MDATEKLLAAIEAVQAEVHATRAESRMRGEETAHQLEKIGRRLDGLEGADKTLTTEFQRLRSKVDDIDRRTDALERDTRRTSERGEETRRTLEAEQAARASEMAGIIGHIEKAASTLHARGEAIDQLKGELDGLSKNDAKQSEALGAIVEELGIQDRVELGPTPKPGEKKPKPVLEKLDRRARSSTIVQVIIALGVIASLLKEVLFPY